MTEEQYLLMCEEMGWEPNPDEMPLQIFDLSYDTQLALQLFNSLPDKVEGMSGSWLGKDLAGLSGLLDIFEVDNRKRVFDLFLMIQKAYAEHYSAQQKMRSMSSKGRK